ncbi:MAG: LysR family transcriptional regulator [Oscillospiraceae bacterium]|nr:LysR family transcriptional regulator [Oscillospiraceae bacterium]
MEIRQLVTFISAARMGSFSKAAEELGYTQSAVTIQIKNLEDELGARLFDRMGKQVTLTDRGRQFLKRANNIVNEITRAKNDVAEGGQLTGTLTIGTNESLCFSKLPAILTYFRLHHPGVNICIVFDSPDPLLEMMEHNQVDLVYFLDEPRYSNHWHKEMEEKEPIVFVCASRCRFNGRENVKVEDFLDQPFFLTEKNANYRRALDKYLASKNILLKPFVEISDTEFILKMVELNNGMSFLPRFAIEKSVEEGRLAIVDTDEPEIYMYRQIFYHKDKWKTPEMDEFIRVAKMDLK